jgi:hypothetical protein
MLKKGDKVVMHSCGEADYYKGKIWTCRSDQFTSSAKQQVVFLSIQSLQLKLHIYKPTLATFTMFLTFSSIS